MTCPEEDILLYAKGFYGRLGQCAFVEAMKRSEALALEQDHAGVDAWRRVAEQIKRLAAADGHKS